MALLGNLLTRSTLIEHAVEETARYRNEVEVLRESLADLELAMDDAGWTKLTAGMEQEFSREGLRSMARNARVFAIGNPLIKRGLAVRQAYVFGQGVEISARANGQGEDGQQDVNAVIQAWWGDPGNQAAVTGGQAQETLERGLGTDGNLFIACFTNPRTGHVQLRTIPFDEVAEVITNPEDRSEPWFYRRQWTARGVNEQGRVVSTIRTDFYPALDYWPARRPRFIEHGEQSHPVHWDAPVHHVKVNHLDGWQFGIGDAYAALAWARAYRDFLADWATLVKSLSQFAWRATSKGSKSAKLRQALSRRPAGTTPTGNDTNAGATFHGPEDVTLEAIPKTGATIDAESGRPLATMVAAALDIPVTTLLSDPGQTGARAVAETLNLPTRLAMMQRQALWTDTYRALAQYVIRQAVKAPGGPLKGTVIRDPHAPREVVSLAGDANADDDTIEVVWPALDDTPLETIMKAIVDADGTGKMPPVQTLKLMLSALGVRDIDELVDQATDDDGNWVDPEATAGRAAVDAWREGRDPAEALRGGQ
ncbi:hypothetical protein SAMN05216184_104111 [Georgenia satyanarayanai]|uniref:Phage portal protein, SPP1 Gp6-like n=1 Tax=Georgenia satyanarayanai TaxID=860221 RepID=A0A2Y9A7R7_9MICO|nr:hypothetical protein [Georgenia satyanarayanai]PYG00172.1 hypothetical protein A8987_104111 [Georgenia satyanarayanai]SSA40400.1 hypothetical protein SAMN05216184_104111 [Georgenia satyanarayanai]